MSPVAATVPFAVSSSVATSATSASSASSSDPLLGRLLPTRLGPLIFDHVLGSGAFSTVYRAIHMLNKTPYAVKNIARSMRGESYPGEQEYQLHKIVRDHPNIARVYEHVLSQSDGAFIVMEYCELGTLLGLVQSLEMDSRSSRADAAALLKHQSLVTRLWIQVVDAVDHCHKKGIRHRDIKLENCLLVRDADTDRLHVRLSDFGLATFSRSTRQRGCGSASSMAPESYSPHGSRIDTAKLDVWSLGMLLIHLVCGLTPWNYAEASRDRRFGYYAASDTKTRLADCLKDSVSYEFIRAVHPMLRVDPSMRCPLADARLGALRSGRWLEVSDDGHFQLPAVSRAISC